MKRKNLIFLMALMFSFVVLMNCESEEPGPDDKEEQQDTTDVSGDGDGDGDGGVALTPEEHKENLQNEGVAFVGEMSRLEDTEATSTFISFGKFVDQSEPATQARINNARIISSRILKITTRELSPTEITEAFQEDPETLTDLWNELKGVFDWNSTTGVWDYTAGGDVVQFNFPSTETGTSNNASFTFQKYVGVTITNPIEEDYAGDLPSEFLVDLVVDDVKEFEFELEINYSDEGEPENVTASLLINPFTLTTELINTETVISEDVSFTNGTDELIGVFSEINGNFDADNIEDAETNEDPTQVVFDGNFDVRIMNIKFTGEGDFATLYDEADAILADEGSAGFNYQEAANDLEVILNNNIDLEARYVDSNDLIAGIEFYTYVESDEWGEWIELGGRLVFADDSRIDLEDYFEEGWEEVEGDLEDLIDEIDADVNS